MTDRLTDAELISTLRIRKEHGQIEAAAILGIASRSMRERLSEAKKRGLRATDTAPDEIATLKARLRVSEHALETIEKDNLSAADIRRTIYGLSEIQPAPPVWLAKTAPATPGASVPMTIWSDWHWGEIVFPEAIGGVNKYNREIAKARLQVLVDNTINLAKHHMGPLSYPGIVIMLGGDMISGNIHEELRETNDGPLQETLLELQDCLTSALAQMADVFGKVFVPCVVGNHGRMKAKPHAKHKVYESYEWNLYNQLERYFRNDPRVSFHIPGEADARFDVLGHRFLLSHGDALGVKGGDGIIGIIGPIARGTMKVHRSQATIGRDFDTLVIGHYHTYVPRGEAAPVIVNGTMKGLDEYAHLFMRVPYSRPSQALWFVHADHGITAQWQVFLDDKHVSSETANWLTWEKRV